MQLPPEDRKYEIVSWAAGLGLFTILKMVLIFFMSAKHLSSFSCFWNRKVCVGQRRAKLIEALKGKLSRHYLILP